MAEGEEDDDAERDVAAPRLDQTASTRRRRPAQADGSLDNSQTRVAARGDAARRRGGACSGNASWQSASDARGGARAGECGEEEWLGGCQG